MQEAIFEAILGLLLLYTGIRIGKNGEVGVLHRYHTQNVSQENMPRFAKRMGQGTVVIGIGCLAIACLKPLFKGDFAYYIGVGLMAVGMVLCIATLYKYNGSLFGWRRPKL